MIFYHKNALADNFYYKNALEMKAIYKIYYNEDGRLFASIYDGIYSCWLHKTRKTHRSHFWNAFKNDIKSVHIIPITSWTHRNSTR